MNRTKNLVLGITAVVLAVCPLSALIGVVGGYYMLHLAARALTFTFETDPDSVARASEAIGDYELPDGFGNPFATTVAGVSLVGYTGSDGHSHIYLCSLPGYARWIELPLREAAYAQWSSSPAQTWVDGNRTVTIGGQAVTLLFTEGINADDQHFRQVTGVIQGKKGPTLVVYETPVSLWDQAEVDTFLASLQ